DWHRTAWRHYPGAAGGFPRRSTGAKPGSFAVADAGIRCLGEVGRGCARGSPERAPLQCSGLPFATVTWLGVDLSSNERARFKSRLEDPILDESASHRLAICCRWTMGRRRAHLSRAYRTTGTYRHPTLARHANEREYCL